MKFAANLNLKGHQFLFTHPVFKTIVVPTFTLYTTLESRLIRFIRCSLVRWQFLAIEMRSWKRCFYNQNNLFLIALLPLARLIAYKWHRMRPLRIFK